MNSEDRLIALCVALIFAFLGLAIYIIETGVHS